MAVAALGRWSWEGKEKELNTDQGSKPENSIPFISASVPLSKFLTFLSFCLDYINDELGSGCVSQISPILSQLLSAVVIISAVDTRLEQNSSPGSYKLSVLLDYSSKC